MPTRPPWLLTVAGVLILVFLMLPTVIVVPMSFSDSAYLEFPPKTWSVRWYSTYFASPQWLDATRTSLVVALATVALATPLGVAAAYGVNAAPPRLRAIVQGVIIAPLIVPSILVAVGVFHLYALIDLNYTLAGVILAHTALALPFVVVTVLAGLRGADAAQELAARSLGAHRLRAVLTVTLPQIRFSVQTAAFLAFITSLDEVVVAMFVSGGDNATITRRMFNSLRDQIDPTIAAISTCLIAVSVMALLAVQAIGARARRGT